MKEENRKEKLTLSNIEGDMKNLSIREIISVFVVSLLMILVILVLMVLDSATEGAISSDAFGVVVLTVLLFALFSLLVFILIKSINRLISIKKKTYIIETDRLINSKSGTGQIVSSNFRTAFYKPFRLYFSQKNRVFKIPEGINYKWSEKHHMYEYSVFNSSNVGDEFYLVIIKNKIICAYNKKLFEME